MPQLTLEISELSSTILAQYQILHLEPPGSYDCSSKELNDFDALGKVVGIQIFDDEQSEAENKKLHAA
jgi:hypothetical protein